MQPNITQHPEPAGVDAGDARVLSSLEQVIQERVDRGIQDLREQAAGLMREIAAEMWREGGADTRDVQERILSFISRDQSVRSLIAHSDERFQALGVRTARLEDALALLSQSTRATQDSLHRSVEALRETSDSLSEKGLATVQERLAGVERQLATAGEELAHRDRTLIEAIQRQIEESGKLIHHETGRIVEAMEGYVKGGLDVMGRMAQRVEEQGDAISARADELEIRIDGAVERAMREHGSEATIRALEERLYGIARLIRSDSQALKAEIDRARAEQSAEMRAELDRRLEGLTERVTTATQRAIAAFASEMDTTLERVNAELDAATARMGEGLEGTAARLNERIEALDATDVGGEIGRGVQTAIDGLTATLDERITQIVESRLAGLARLLRAENEALAGKIDQFGEQDTAKQTLRAVKELQSTMPETIHADLERRFATFGERLHRDTQATVEAVAKAADSLGHRVDRAVSAVSDAQQDELQAVIERMGDAMHALASVGRPAAAATPAPRRIEVE